MYFISIYDEEQFATVYRKTFQSLYTFPLIRFTITLIFKD